MKKDEIAVATISWARNREEEQTLRASLEELAKLQLPVFITDGGSSAEFIAFLKSFPQFRVFSAKGLWPQAKNSVTEAKRAGAKAIFYTEPDKQTFFSAHLLKMVEEASFDDSTGVMLASRSARGFATFPPFQQITETTINECCFEVIKKRGDYCYGPFLFHSRLVDALSLLGDNCGWGWRPFLFAMAHRVGLSVDAYKADFECPPDQREEDATERIYRMKQLTQNIDGLVLATTVQL